jgi:hypothetical protein
LKSLSPTTIAARLAGRVEKSATIDEVLAWERRGLGAVRRAERSGVGEAAVRLKLSEGGRDRGGIFKTRKVYFETVPR